MEHPSETFLASLEEDLMRLTVKHGQTVWTMLKSIMNSNNWFCRLDLKKTYLSNGMDFLSAEYTGVITHARFWDNTRKVCKSQALIFQVVQSCISCLGAVVNKVTHNIRLVKDYFLKYHGKSQFPSRIPVLIFSGSRKGLRWATAIFGYEKCSEDYRNPDDQNSIAAQIVLLCSFY